MKKLFLTSIVLLFLSSLAFSQLTEISKFPAQDTTTSHFYSSIIELDNGSLLFIWPESGQLKASSSNDGINWSAGKKIAANISDNVFLQDIAAYKTNSGKILIAYRIDADTTEYNLITSTNNGLTWSTPSFLIKDITDNRFGSWNVKFSQTDDGKIWLTFNRTLNLSYITSDDDGTTWSAVKTLLSFASYGNIISIGDSLALFFERRNKIMYQTTNDGGITWSKIDTINFGNNFEKEPFVVKKNDGSLVMILKASNTAILGNYYFTESYDDGKTWSNLKQFTKYCGIDSELEINTNSEKMYASFVSERSLNEPDFISSTATNTIWYGIVGVSDDKYTPPVISNITRSIENPTAIDTLVINAKVYDDESVAHVYLRYKLNDIEQVHIEMFDDGLHFDGEANDSIYGTVIDSFKSHDVLLYSVTATDNNNNSSVRFGDTVNIGIPYTYDRYLIDVNRFKMPLNNRGILADVRINDEFHGGSYDSLSVLFSGGFFLSGYSNGELWANAQFSTSRIEHYLPGKVGSNEDDPANKVYLLTSSDKPFGISWQSWEFAVNQGAKFYDGNGDGIYNPVDLNGNGLWDENEDRPDLIGDITTWTVFNDGVLQDLRNYEVSPKDIEIKQTVFGYNTTSHEELDGIIFIRYNIENKSAEVYDSVYFSVVTDPDIGEYYNDLVGCDTTINSGFAYDNGEDATYGNSPTFMMTLLQGAPVYIPGKTFIDSNNNGIYDEGTDTPLDTAVYKHGEVLTEEIFPGAKNQDMTSFMHYMSSHPTLGDPDNQVQLRNYQIGLQPNGIQIDPCNWEFGKVFNVNCSDVNPSFMYSGNPVTQYGWINDNNNDQRIMLNSGPYTLAPNKPIEIIAAYVVGRGNTSLESIDITKKLAKNALGFYGTNFKYVPVGVNTKQKKQIPTEFSLSQNYPNPFNPTTTIKYSIPYNVLQHGVETTRQVVSTKLIVYDILGREVATIVNKEQTPGNYEVVFSASKFSSGVYIYTLKCGQFISSKKMILLK